MRLRLLVTSVLTAALLVPTGALASEEPAPEPAPDPMVGAPAVGECSTMSLQAAYRQSVPKKFRERCGKQHTTEVVAVGELPEDVTWDEPSKVWAAASGTCTRAWRKYWGVKPLLQHRSLYVGYWFMPSDELKEKGARWFRCDRARQADDRLLTQQGRFTAEVTKWKVPDEVGRCATKLALRTVACDKAHGWRHTGAFLTDVLPKKEARRAEEIRKLGTRRCPKHVSTRRYAWSAHHHEDGKYVIVCLSRKQ